MKNWIRTTLLIPIAIVFAEDNSPAPTDDTDEPVLDRPERIYEPSTGTGTETTEDVRWKKTSASSRFGSPGKPNQLKLKNRADKRVKGAWQREVSLGANATRGNSDTSLYEGGFEFSRKLDNQRVVIDGQARYGKSDGTRNKENGRAGVRYENDFTENRYGAFEMKASYDALADLDYRIVWTLAHGWYLKKTDDTVVNVEIGPGYLQEKKNDERDGYFVLRLGEALDYRLNDYVVLWHSAEYLPNVQDFNQYLINAEVGIESALTGQLRFRTVAQERYDSQPAAGKENSDFVFSASLVLSF